jgi:hypothetical protein
MTITRTNPNTIFLGGGDDRPIIVNDLATAAIVTPGMLIERDNVGGVIRWKLATADIAGETVVALDQSEVNKGVDDTYAVGDLVKAAHLRKGETAWMLIASGQNVDAGDLLGSAGGGTLKTGATVARFLALENKPTVTVLTRIRVSAI